MSDKPNIGRAEMDVLQYVAQHHPITIREVANHISETKGHVRTTVLNVMERLRKKGYLRRKKQNGLFEYSPTLPRTDLLRDLVRDFVQKTLGGSVSPFVAFLAEEGELSPEEIARLKKLVRELENEDRN